MSLRAWGSAEGSIGLDISSGTASGASTLAIDGFLACPMVDFAAEVAAAFVAALGRVPVVLVEEASGALAVVRLVEDSAAGRLDVRGRLVAAVVVDGAIEALDEVVLPGEARVGAVAVEMLGARRTVVFRFSSPEVTDECSASEEAVLLASVVLLTLVPGTGRVGGLFRLEPTVLVRDEAVVVGFDAVVDARAVLVEAAGRRAPTVAVPPVDAVASRRGGTGSLEPEEGALEAILRRRDDAGVEGAGNFLCGVVGLCGASEGTTLSASVAGGASMLHRAVRGGLRGSRTVRVVDMRQ